MEENAVIAQLTVARRAQVKYALRRISLRLTAPVDFRQRRRAACRTTVLHRLLNGHRALDGGPGSVWLNELIWREFYRHLMTGIRHYTKHQPFIRWTKRVAWQENPLFSGMAKGETGCPLSMRRCASRRGWMRNRLRMITANFLVKDLLIDWRLGSVFHVAALTAILPPIMARLAVSRLSRY